MKKEQDLFEDTNRFAISCMLHIIEQLWIFDDKEEDRQLCMNYSSFFDECPRDLLAQYIYKAIGFINVKSPRMGVDFLYEKAGDGNAMLMLDHIAHSCIGACLFEESVHEAELYYILKKYPEWEDASHYVHEWEDWMLWDLDITIPFLGPRHWLTMAQKINWPISTSIPINQTKACAYAEYEGAQSEWIGSKKYDEYLSLLSDNKHTKKAKSDQCNYTPGNVYLMMNEVNQRVKIGRTKNKPQYRERTLQSQEPEITLLYHKKAKCMVGTEKHLHKKFKNKRYRGEWFDLSTVEIEDAKSLIKRATHKIL